MNFQRTTLKGPFGDYDAYIATSGQWKFLILSDGNEWTASYRLRESHARPGLTVSASSTIMGPFLEFADATKACDETLAALRRMA